MSFVWWLVTVHQAKRQSQQQCQKEYNNNLCNLTNRQVGSVSKKLWSFIKQKNNNYCWVAPLQDNGVTYIVILIVKLSWSMWLLAVYLYLKMFLQCQYWLFIYADMPWPPIQINSEDILHFLLDLNFLDSVQYLLVFWRSRHLNLPSYWL